MGLNRQRLSLLITGTLLIFLSAGLRFYRLGDWPFAGDEILTFPEVDSLFQEPSGTSIDQKDRLPRLIPLAYALHYVDYNLFGRDEYGSRVLMAILGTASVAVVFFGLEGTLGRASATAAGLLLALWPEHLFQSQQNRFYAAAQFFTAACMVLGSMAVRRRSSPLVLCACVAAAAALLSHTLLGMLFGGLLAAFIMAALAERHRPPARPLAIITISSVVAAGFFLFYLYPLVKGWNTAGGWWGYSLSHSVLASLNQVGWPIALFATVAGVGFLAAPSGQGWYWLTWGAFWAGATVFLPKFVTYHPAYVFPLATSVLVLAGVLIGRVFVLLEQDSRLMAWTWMVAACACGLPSTLSYFSDGSRHDFRTAARYISEHRRPGDRVASVAPTLLAHYLPGDAAVIPLRGADPVPELRQLAKEGRGLWVVLSSSRWGLPAATRRWLEQNCVREAEIRNRRYDYQEFTVEVFLTPRPSAGGPSE